MSDTKPAPAEQSDVAETPTDAQEQADFAGGFADGKPSLPTKADKSEKSEKPEPAETPREKVEADDDGPVTLTRKQLAALEAAVARTTTHEQQFAKAWGTIGNLQKLLNEQKAAAAATPAEKRRVELPKDAFREMEADFPELAAQIRTALEHSLAHLPGTAAADADTAKIEGLWREYTAKRELETLTDAYPNWREITGAVNAAQGEQPDPNNAFRSWLATKELDYQQRVNASESAAVITRAIRTFQRESAQQPKPVTGTPRDTARADRIRSAVQPRGDNRAGPPGNSEQDEFEAGFAGR